MIATTIIGIGSPYGDDQVGWLAIDHLQQQWADQPELTFMKSNSLDWLTEINQAEQVFFIDAVVSDQPPGKIHAFPIKHALPGHLKLNTSSHGISLWESIQLAQNLSDFDLPIYFFGIEIQPEQTLLCHPKDANLWRSTLTQQVVQQLAKPTPWN